MLPSVAGVVIAACMLCPASLWLCVVIAAYVFDPASLWLCGGNASYVLNLHNMVSKPVISVGKDTFKMYTVTEYRIHAQKCNM